MTLEERAERFYNFPGCLGTACAECSYHGCGPCKDAIHEDAVELLKHETLKREAAEEVAHTLKRMDDAAKIAENEDIKEFEATIRPIKFETPLTMKEREQIKELIRVKTEVPDISAHFIQEINELCVELNSLAAVVGKLEQVTKGTDPVGKDDNDADALVEAVNVSVADVIAEAADVHNYLFVLGFDHLFTSWPDDRDHKLARWANRLNGVSDE